jgi:hypothetical protein
VGVISDVDDGVGVTGTSVEVGVDVGSEVDVGVGVNGI